MGFFGKSEKQKKAEEDEKKIQQQLQDELKRVRVAYTDVVKFDYEVIFYNLIASYSDQNLGVAAATALAQIKRQAVNNGANWVIGVKFAIASNRDYYDVIATGVAVYTKDKEGGQIANFGN